MRAHRVLAFLATAGAVLVATASIALVGPGVAAAAPGGGQKPAAPSGPQSYPPPPPLLVSNRGTVKVGQKIRLFGNHFGYRETVVIRVAHGPTIRVTTDRYGRFGSSVQLNVRGTITITALGKTSGFTASVTITVTGKRMGHAVPAAPHITTTTPLVVFTPLLPDNNNLGLGAGNFTQNGAGTAANLVANSDDLTPAGSQFPLGAVGAAAALLGLGLVALLTFKRRRGTTQD